jgi:hypothetical protein
MNSPSVKMKGARQNAQCSWFPAGRLSSGARVSIGASLDSWGLYRQGHMERSRSAAPMRNAVSLSLLAYKDTDRRV